MQLAGKRAVVTGSSTGIGRSVALKLAQQGAEVVINARGVGADGTRALDEVVDEINRTGGKAVGYRGGVDDPDVAERLIACCVESFGGIDILISNAGVFSLEAGGPVDRCSLDEWRRTMQINLDAAFFTCRAALPHMQKQRWGRVVFAASSAGLGVMGGSAYTASKSALFGLSRAIAAEYGPYGITCNCYNPEARGAMGGTAAREVFDKFLNFYAAKGFQTTAEGNYMAGIGAPDTVAAWVAYLCAEEADYINGRTFAIDARRVALLDLPEECRVLFKDAQHGPWTIAELQHMAPLVFPLVNRWPRREGAAFVDWESATLQV